MAIGLVLRHPTFPHESQTRQPRLENINTSEEGSGTVERFELAVTITAEAAARGSHPQHLLTIFKNTGNNVVRQLLLSRVTNEFVIAPLTKSALVPIQRAPVRST